MKDINIQEEIIVNMINKAKKARKNSYSPYSNFSVGAALLTSCGNIVTGCNVENAAFTPGNCAERTAIFKAISEGYKEFSAIAIVGGKASDENISDYVSPCGVCRQVLREFVNPKTFYVIMAKSENDYTVRTLEELLPMSFGPDNLK